jgi:hypothetical protein
MSQFPNIVDEGKKPVVLSDGTTFRNPAAIRHRRKVRIVVESHPALKSRLDALAFETNLPVAEIGRYALWSAVLDAEPNKKRFCQKVAREKLRHVEQERIR